MAIIARPSAQISWTFPHYKYLSVVVVQTVVWTDTWCADFGNSEHLWLPKYLSALEIIEIRRNTDTDLCLHHLFAFTGRLLIFVYYVCALVQYCITVLDTFVPYMMYVCIYAYVRSYIHTYIHTYIIPAYTHNSEVPDSQSVSQSALSDHLLHLFMSSSEGLQYLL